MAGIAALLNQKMGGAQGNLNPGLYKLAPLAGNIVYHDITVATSHVDSCDVSIPSMCNNSTPGVDGLQDGLPGYLVGPGYDLYGAPQVGFPVPVVGFNRKAGWSRTRRCSKRAG